MTAEPARHGLAGLIRAHRLIGPGLFIFLVSVLAYVILGQMHTRSHVEINVTAERCILNTEDGFGVTGFWPVSRCVLTRADSIALGSGTLIVDGEPPRRARSIDLLRTGGESTSLIDLNGSDLAFGRLSGRGPAAVDVSRLSPVEVDVKIVPPVIASPFWAELSLGDSCVILTRGFTFLVDGEPAYGGPDGQVEAVFAPERGAAHVADREGGFDFRIESVDDELDLEKTLPISGVRFLDANNLCAGVSGGTVQVSGSGEVVVPPPNCCLRLTATEINLRRLAFDRDSPGLQVSLSGHASELRINEAEILPTMFSTIGESKWGLVILGMLGFVSLSGGLLVISEFIRIPRRS